MSEHKEKTLVKTPEQLRKVIFKHFEPLFKKVNQNAHDVIEDKELRTLIAEILLKKEADVTKEEIEHYTKEIGASEAGKVTYQDYFKYFFGERAKNLVKAHFDKFDKNHDQFLDKTEFKNLLISTFSSLNVELTDELINWNLKKFDDNNDGKISMAEYVKLAIAYV